MLQITDTPYEYDERLNVDLIAIQRKVLELRAAGSLSPDVLRHLRKFFRIKNIYNSNAIEGNRLNVGETRLVVEEGLTITGKPLKDTIEAKNLSHALDLFEELADRDADAITEADIRSVHAAILSGIDNAAAGSYRTTNVEISGSAFKPPAHFDVPREMEQFGKWLARITTTTAVWTPAINPVLLAAAAHAWFVYIHPFVDGNGRTARLIMNCVLMRCGYPIAIITTDDRQRYYDALEDSQAGDLTAFIGLVAECVNESLEEYQHAAAEQKERNEWLRSVVSSMGAREAQKLRLEYDVWRSAIDLLKNYFAQTVAMANEADTMGVVQAYFKDFGHLEFEKYASLKRGNSAKRTWSFRVDFRSGSKATRFLFFFGFASFDLEKYIGKNNVSLHVSFEDTPFHFERTEYTNRSDLPDLIELGYNVTGEKFFGRYRGGLVRAERVEDLGRHFIEQIAKRCF